MNLWIVTIGSSDVQLDSNKVNSDKGRTEKQRSDKVWQYWYEDTIKAECYDISFEPKRAFPDSDESYRIAPRILGIVYESSSEKVKQEIQNYLTFPLLSNFVAELKKLAPPEAIAILLTDQSEIFKDDNKRHKPKSPYWQDTCKLEPIINGYLQQEFPGVEILPLILSPQEEPGLDDWDRVLDLVRDELKKIQLQSEADTVYVSHQAGTPAISSAVQFVSLGKFAEKVQFLVSNEYEKKALEPIESSKYLKEIKFGQAKELLKNHDYAAVQSLLKDYLDSETQILLNAAIEWNYAKFGEFAKKLKELSDQAFVQEVNARTKEENWWWTAYEAAYLATIRHEQKNIVEALFHSFRSVEGLVCKWAEEKYKQYIYYDEKGSPQIQEEIQDILPEYWEKIKNKNSAWIEDLKKQNENRQAKGKEPKPISVGLFSQNLYFLLEFVRSDCKKDPSLKKGLYSAKDERNQQFHRLLGLREEDLFKAWKADDIDSWKSILLGCLNFIAKEDLPQEFTSLEDASLMAKVHDELVDAIARYELQK